MSVVVTVAPTGLIATKADNPNLPTQPAEIAAAVEAGYHLGASVAHIHLRDEDDQPTADLGIARRAAGLPEPRKASDKSSDNAPQASPDGARLAQTLISVWPAVIRRNAMPSDETGMHGKEKVYGSIP